MDHPSMNKKMTLSGWAPVYYPIMDVLGTGVHQPNHFHRCFVFFYSLHLLCVLHIIFSSDMSVPSLSVKLLCDTQGLILNNSELTFPFKGITQSGSWEEVIHMREEHSAWWSPSAPYEWLGWLLLVMIHHRSLMHGVHTCLFRHRGVNYIKIDLVIQG